MIRSRTTRLENLQITAGLLRYAVQHLDEVFLRNASRATARDQHTARFEYRHTQAVQPMICLERLAQLLAAAGELRRIENHRIKPFSRRRQLLQRFEGIALLKPHLGSRVLLRVQFCQQERIGRPVDS